MSYKLALETAGAVIKEYKEFGSYQGTWIAVLENGNIVEGSYGSCSGCDSFHAEFDYHEILEEQEDGKYYRNNYHWDEDELISKEEAEEINEQYKQRLVNFGLSYLNEQQSFEEALNRYKIKCEDEYAWEDDKGIYEWLKSRV